MLTASPITPDTSLHALLTDIIAIDPPSDRIVQGLSTDSRETQMGDLYLSYLGAPDQWSTHTMMAIERGAVAVLQEATATSPAIEFRQIHQLTVPIIYVTDLYQQVGIIAARFYGNPAAALNVIGITGTSGKTSCSQFIAKALQLANQPCGVIGTLGHGFPDQLQPSDFTTPNALELQQALARLRAQQAKAVAMEVSSHALDLNRIGGTQFTMAVFTNLSRDHLDYHGDMTRYSHAKRKLFSQPGLKYAVINADDAYGRELIAELANTSLTIYAYSSQNFSADVPTIRAEAIKVLPQGLQATLHTPWGKGILRSTLLGRFNISNLLATLTVLLLADVPLAQALNYLAQMTTVPGRMQPFGGGKSPLVVVDYAHKPDALEKALMALREHCQGKLWCVFGCGGNRDRGKRAQMAQIAERLSDQIIITDDNPRDENPEQITQEIVQGLVCPWAAEVEHDRQAAIAHAIDCAQPGDVVLIAGKGHETYQLIGTEKLAFNDAEQVSLQLKQRQGLM